MRERGQIRHRQLLPLMAGGWVRQLQNQSLDSSLNPFVLGIGNRLRLALRFSCAGAISPVRCEITKLTEDLLFNAKLVNGIRTTLATARDRPNKRRTEVRHRQQRFAASFVTTKSL